VERHAVTLILFVCRGNTCRSPMAEVIARNLAERQGLTLQFASAGTTAAADAVASRGALASAANAGLDLSRHRARAAGTDLLAPAHRILALDQRIYADLIAGAPADMKPRIAHLVAFAPGLGIDEITDPWGGSTATYDKAFRDIKAAVAGLVEGLRNG
jgi:protein-tyrosine phosphatase